MAVSGGADKADVTRSGATVRGSLAACRKREDSRQDWKERWGNQCLSATQEQVETPSPNRQEWGLGRERSVGWLVAQSDELGALVARSNGAQEQAGSGDVAAPDPTDRRWNKLGSSSQAMLAQAIAPVDIDVKDARKLVKASTTSDISDKNKSEMSARSR